MSDKLAALFYGNSFSTLRENSGSFVWLFEGGSTLLFLISKSVSTFKTIGPISSFDSFISNSWLRVSFDF